MFPLKNLARKGLNCFTKHGKLKIPLDLSAIQHRPGVEQTGFLVKWRLQWYQMWCRVDYFTVSVAQT